MKTTFIITSAIFTNLGPLNSDIRILQTFDTIKSIRRHYADANIILIEGGAPIQSNQLWEQLKASVNVFMDLSKNEQIQHLHTVMNQVGNKYEMGGVSGLAKSVAELTLMVNVLDALKNHPDMKPALEADRIFKISGRYQLSPVFDPAVYEKAAGKYVFKKRDKSWMPDALKTVGTDHGFSSRLWSFDRCLLDETVDKFNAMLDDMMEISNEHYIDVEHLLYKHIGPDNAMELDTTHLFGTIGPNVTLIYD